MSKIYANGVATVTLAANDKVAVFSYSPTKVYQQVGYPNQPDSWDLLVANAANTSYTSSAFASGATLRIEASASDAFYEVGADPVIGDPTADISAADATFTVTGLAAAQGGSVTMRGGTSSTAGNAGGAALVTGGTPGVTGVGGAATIAAGLGGATSGAGGVASLTGGAGTAGNSAGGISKIVGGAGQGTAAGGKAQVVGGASGAGATGNGAQAEVTGGAAASTNGSGGSVVLTPGAKAGSGIAGGVIQRSATGQYWKQQPAAVAKADGAETITGAQMIGGIVVFTVTQARTMTTPTGAALLAACPADIAAGDSFEFTMITLGAGADDIATLTAGDGDVTFVGDVTVGPGAAGTTSSGTWCFRYAGVNAFVGYRK
jgi:hypothetical protein